MQHENDFLQPLAVDVFEEIPSRRAPRISGGKDKQTQIGERQELPCDDLVIGHDRIRAGRVHDVEILQLLARAIALRELRGDGHVALFFVVFENVDLVRRRQHIHAAKLLAKERIQERRLARFHLAHDYK